MVKKADKRSQLIQRALNNVQRRFGDKKVLVGLGMEDFPYLGIPLHPVCLQYLFQADIIPLEKLIHLYGDWDTCKTVFALYLISEFIAAGGYGIYIDAERKLPWDLVYDIIGKEALDGGRLVYQQSGSAEEVQEFMFSYLEVFAGANNDIRKANDSRKDGESPIPEIPTLLVLDSLAAALPVTVKEGIWKERHNNVTVAPYARVWTKPFSELTSALVDLRSRMTVLIINHERQTIQFSGRSKPGGGMQDFLGFLMLRFSHGRGRTNSQEVYPSYGLKHIKIATEKNSMGTRRREIELSAKWGLGESDLPFHFEFDKSTIELISSQLGAGKTLGPLEDIKSYRGLYRSESLGMETGEEPAAFLARIESSEEVMNGIRTALGIKRRHILGQESVAEESTSVEADDE